MKRIGGGKKRLNVWQRTQLRGAKGENWRRGKRLKNKSKKETFKMDKFDWILTKLEGILTTLDWILTKIN